MSKKSLPKRLKASTLVEVLVSFSIIAIIFVLGSQLWSQAILKQSPMYVFRGRAFIREVIDKPVHPNEVGIDTMKRMPFVCIRHIRPYQTEPYLREVSVQCYWQNRLIGTRKRYIRVQDL